MKIKNFLRFFVGFLILILLIYFIGIDKVIKTIPKFNLLFIIPILILMILTYLIEAYKIKIMLKPEGINITMKRSFHYYIVSWIFGLITPARLGEFSMSYFLDKDGYSMGKSMAVLVLNRIVNLLLLVIIAILGFFIFFTINQAIKLTLVLFLLIIILFFVILSKRIRRYIKRIISRKYRDKFKNFSKSFYYFIRYRKKLLCLVSILALVKWLITFFIVYIAFLAFKEQVSFFMISLISAITLIISFIPISIAGLGTKEVSAVYFYSLINIAPEITTSLYIILLFLSYISAIIGLIYYFITRK